jgi:hypothetical protein
MKRMLEGDGSLFERDILGALKSERPSAELEQRMRDALGLGPAPSIPPPAPPVAAAKAGLGVGAVAAGAAVAALLVGGGLMLRQSSAPTHDLTSAPAARAPEPTPATPAPAVAPEPPSPEPAAAEQDAPKPRATHAAPPSQSLREEIQLIDQARVAVKNHDGEHARKLLDQYARRFPNGAFREEARVLRREAKKTE